MELKQLEYFTVVCEQGSFNRAAECLYTSQPNVSKVILSLERELGRPLFERSPRGLRITAYGRTVQEYARVVLRHTAIIRSMADHNRGKKFALAAYPSNMIARLLADFYLHWRDQYLVEHYEGSVEEVSDYVVQGRAELGIVYIAQRQLSAFRHILSHKKLVFQPLAVKEVCLYVGPHHPLYARDSIAFSELAAQRFIGGVHDYFSVEHHLERVSLGVISTGDLDYAMQSNSDHMTLAALLHTDLCSLGLNFLHEPYRHYEIKTLRIDGCEPFLTLGYVQPEDEPLGEAAEWFLSRLRALL